MENIIWILLKRLKYNWDIVYKNKSAHLINVQLVKFSGTQHSHVISIQIKKYYINIPETSCLFVLMLGNSICVGLFLGSFGKDWYYYNIEFSNLWTWPISYKGKLYDSTTSLGNAGKSGREWPSSPFFLGLLRIPAGGCPALPYPPGRMRTCSLAWWGEWTCHREPPVFWPPFPLHCPNHCRCLVSSSLHRTSFIVSSHFSLDPPRRIFRVTQSKAFAVAFYLRCRILSPAPFPANHFGEVLLTVPCDLTSHSWTLLEICSLCWRV